jgi:hypothetical protein
MAESAITHLTIPEMLIVIAYLLSAWYLVRTGMLTQFLLDDSGKLSNSKLWSFVANAVGSYVVIHYTMDGKLTSEFFLIYMGVVGSGAVANKLIAFKYGGATDAPSASHEVPDANPANPKRNPVDQDSPVPNADTPDDPDSNDNVSRNKKQVDSQRPRSYGTTT